jgi:hypothetical protein
MANKTTLKNWFKTGLKPTQAQFWAWLDAFWHKDEVIPQSSINGLETTLNAKAELSQLEGHKVDPNAHNEKFALKEDKSMKGQVSGYAPLNEFTKLASIYLDIVDDLDTGGSDNILSAEQGKVLQEQINNINLLLTSDNINLDTIQEIVDAIQDFQNSIDTLLVNDLVTGGLTKALTAEKGKLLKELIDSVQDNLDNEALIREEEDAKKVDVENQVEVSASMDAQASWHGKTVLFTANVTIVIPATGLPLGWNFEGITMPSCAVTWGISAPKIWLFGTPAVTPEKKIFTVMQQKTDSNKIMLLGV